MIKKKFNEITFTEKLHKKFKIDPQQFFHREINYTDLENLRTNIITSELEDFYHLIDPSFNDQIEKFQNILLKRYQIEGRNSFNHEVLEKYAESILKLEELKLTLQSQRNFYQERVDQIKKEFKNYDNKC